MHKRLQDRSLIELSREPVNAAPPPFPASHNSRKCTLHLLLHHLVLACCIMLLCLLISTVVTRLQHKKQVLASQPSIPFMNPNTSRVAICLVGGARRFELTGPTILKHMLNVLPEADLYVHSNMDENCFKLGLFRSILRIIEVRIRRPVVFPVTDVHMKLLKPVSSPNGIQGYLQYFDLVEGCLDMIGKHESQGNFTYDWILRARVDSYWTDPLDMKSFKQSSYVVPEGSRFKGLNDRLGIGNRYLSNVALSRLSILPQLASAGFHGLVSENAFSAQLTMFNISTEEVRFPFCILTERQFPYPSKSTSIPIASISSPGPLSGAYCRPCIPQCKGECVAELGMKWDKSFAWTEWTNGSLELCDGSGPWQEGWEEIFDEVACKVAANVRRKYKEMKIKECVREMDDMKRKTERWNSPDSIEICNLGLSHAQ